MTMNREFLINSILAIALVAVPLIALGMDEPFIITLGHQGGDLCHGRCGT